MSTFSTGQVPSVTLPASQPTSGSQPSQPASGPRAAEPEARRLSVSSQTAVQIHMPRAMATGSVPTGDTGARLQTEPLLDSKATGPASSPAKTTPEVPPPLYSRPADADVDYFGATVGEWFAATYHDAEGGWTELFQCKTLSVNTTRTLKDQGVARTQIEFTSTLPDRLRTILGLPPDPTGSEKISCELSHLLDLTHWYRCLPAADIAKAIESKPVDVCVIHMDSRWAADTTLSRCSWRHRALAGEGDVPVQLSMNLDEFPPCLTTAGFVQASGAGEGAKVARGLLKNLFDHCLVAIPKPDPPSYFKNDLQLVPRDRFVTLLKEPHGSSRRFALQVGHWFSEDVRCQVVTGKAARDPSGKWPPATGTDDMVIRIKPRRGTDKALSDTLCSELETAGFAPSSDGRAWTGRVSMLPKTVSVYGDKRCFTGDEPFGPPAEPESPEPGSTGTTATTSTSSTTSTTSTTASTTASTSSSSGLSPTTVTPLQGVARAKALAKHEGPVAMMYVGDAHDTACREHDLRVLQAGDGTPDLPLDSVLCRAKAPIHALKAYIHMPKDTKASEGWHYYAVPADFMKPLDAVPSKQTLLKNTT